MISRKEKRKELAEKCRRGVSKRSSRYEIERKNRERERQTETDREREKEKRRETKTYRK